MSAWSASATNALRVACPACGAEVGQACLHIGEINRDGPLHARPCENPHRQRMRAAKSNAIDQLATLMGVELPIYHTAYVHQIHRANTACFFPPLPPVHKPGCDCLEKVL